MSPNEIKLLSSVIQDFDKILKHIGPMSLWGWAAREAFANNLQGNNIEALRRGIKHLDGGGLRNNPEFESLIAFED